MSKNLVFGVGINDLPGWSRSSDKKRRWIYSEWNHMLARCYSENYHQQFPTYKDCTVCERWKTFSNFVYDAPLLPGFEQVVAFGFKGMSLDKDKRVIGNKEYSPDTCTWLTKSENPHERNVRLGSPMKDPEVVKKVNTPEAHKKKAIALGHPVVGIDPDGNYHEWYGTAEAARQLGCNSSIVHEACSGAKPHTKTKGKLKGWSFYWKEEKNDCK